MTESEARPAASATPASALTGRRSTPPGPLDLRPVALIKGIVDAVGQFRSLAEPLANTVTDTEWLMIGVLRGFADVERDLIRTRTAEGRSWAKARGQHIARPNLYQPPLKPTLGAHVPVMPARAGLHAVMGERGAYWCGRVILTASRVLDTFSKHRYGPAMPDTPHLRPAAPDEIADALSFALRYQGRRRVHHADDMMARITAERLVQHLEASGFVVMKGQAARAPTTANMPPAVE